MRRLAAVLSALTLLAVACSDDSTSTTQASVTTGASATTRTATTQTATAQADTTTTPVTTTTPATTTAPTTTVPQPDLLPDARSRQEVPWGDVDQSWALALYSTVAGYSDLVQVDEEMVIAYLVAPDGSPYEITSWPQSEAPFGIYDVRPDGQAALLAAGSDPVLLDLTTGATSQPPIPDDTMLFGFTRPTGRDYLALTFDSVIEMFSGGGNHMATLGEFIEEEDFHFGPQRPWVFAPTGLSLVVNGLGGPAHVSNQGNHLRDLETPGELCHVLAWWNDIDVLMRCLTPYEGRNVFTLWLVDSEGMYGPMQVTTAADAGSDPIMEGFINAVQGGNRLFIQGFVAAGSGWYPIYRMEQGVGPVALGNEVAGQLIAAGPSTVTAHRLGCCGEIYGALITYDHDGNEIARLDAPEGYFGVVAAHGVGAPAVP